MKKNVFAFIAALALVSGVTAQQKPAPKSNPKEDTIQYSLGVYMMQQYFAKSGMAVTNPTLFKKAIDDVLAGRKLMVDPATTQDRLISYQREFLLAKGRTLENLLVEKVKKEKGFMELGSTGIYYSMVQQGKGSMPAAKDTVILNLITTLPDGTVVDDTNKSKTSYMALAGEMIPGLRELLVRMPEGSVIRAVVPARYAYGEQGNGVIPPNSAVIYDVALVTVKAAKK
jgi:FKBP-type peptidyl-prolyl cis-trans isomerase